MSIWNIVEYKPRAPQAQGNLQSAYTVESDRIKPDLIAGFRVQSSDQNQYPNNSFLFLENAARLPQIDPFAWGGTYENILQVKEDYNRGFTPTLDCLSVRQQSQVSADGVPTNPPPPSQPVEPTPLTQNNSNHGGALKTEQKNANHENGIVQADEKRRKYEQDMLSMHGGESYPSYESKPNFVYGDQKQEQEEKSPEQRTDVPPLENVSKKKYLNRALDALNPYNWFGRRNSAPEMNEYKDSMYPARQKERQNQEIGNLLDEGFGVDYSMDDRLDEPNIVEAVQIELGKFSDKLRRAISQDTSLNQGEMMNKISEIQDIVQTYATELGTIVAQVDAIEKDMYVSNENQKSILNELADLRTQFLNIANRKQVLEDELKSQSQNARRLSGAELAGSNMMQSIQNLTTAVNNIRESNAKDLNALSVKMNALEAALAERVIKLDSISTSVLKTVSDMQSNFQNERKSISDTVNFTLNNFQQPILQEIQSIRGQLSTLQKDMESVKAQGGKLSVDNRRMYEELSDKFKTFLESATNIMGNSEARIVDNLRPYLARTNIQGQEISLYDLAATGFQNLIENQIDLGNSNDARYSNIENEFKSLENSLKSLNPKEQYVTIQNTLNQIKSIFPELADQLDVLQSALATFDSQLDQPQVNQQQADPLNYNVTDLSFASNSTNPFVKKRKSIPPSQGSGGYSANYPPYRSGGGGYGLQINVEEKQQDSPTDASLPSYISRTVATVSPTSPQWINEIKGNVLKTFAKENGMSLTNKTTKEQIYNFFKSNRNLLDRLKELHNNPSNRMSSFK